jgi:hypothetical protein
MKNLKRFFQESFFLESNYKKNTIGKIITMKLGFKNSKLRGKLMKYEIQSKNGYKIVSLNRRKAIREKCLNCSGWSYKEVQSCQFEDCELHFYRTGMGKQSPKARSQSIRAYCLSCMGGQRSEISKCTSPTCSLFPYRQSRVDRSFEIIDSRPKKQPIERRIPTHTSRPIPKYRSTVPV